MVVRVLDVMHCISVASAVAYLLTKISGCSAQQVSPGDVCQQKYWD
jgi:hypothetical protein